jgi:hypothetical protein
MTDASNLQGGDPLYAYKPSLIAAPWELRLEDDALAWRAGRRAGRVPYGDIARVRMSYRPVTMQTRRFITEIWPGGPAGGAKLSIPSTTWRSMVEQAPQDQAYGAFIRELHRRIAARDGAPSFETGLPGVLYWPGLAVFAAAALALAALTLRALQTGELAGAAFVGAFLALFVWQSGSYFRRNRPGRYRPDALPRELVP